MSRKAARFAAVITNPLNVHNFQCFIPGLEDEKTMIIESTSFPTEKFRTLTLWFQGEPIHYPGLPENDHTWKFKLPEGDNAITARSFQNIKDDMYTQKTGILIPSKFKSVEIRSRDLSGNIVFYVILHGSWLRGRDPVGMVNNNPAESWKWDYEWVYDWIEDKINDLEGSDNPYTTG